MHALIAQILQPPGAAERGRETMSSNTISILEGNTFVVCDLRGDIDASPTDTTGLFSYDTRFLSRWILTIDGVRPNVLSTDDLDYFVAQFFLVPGTGTVYVDADLSILRKRSVVANGSHEDVTILNHKHTPVDLTLHFDTAADFADVFEIKDALTKKAQLYQRINKANKALILGYRRERFVRETHITPTVNATFDEHSISFHVHIEPHREWTVGLDVDIFKSAAEISASPGRKMHTSAQAPTGRSSALRQWLGEMGSAHV